VHAAQQHLTAEIAAYYLSHFMHENGSSRSGFKSLTNLQRCLTIFSFCTVDSQPPNSYIM